MSRWLALLCLLLPGLARADEGAISLEVGLAGVVGRTPVPLGEAGDPLHGLSGAVQLGGRYALKNWLEVGAHGFFEAPSAWFHAGALLQRDGTSFPGTLESHQTRWGAFAEARAIRGLVFRPFVSLGLGWVHRRIDRLTLYDVRPAPAVDYGLGLEPVSYDALLVRPGVGLEWQAGDHWSLSLAPAALLHVGPRPTWAVTLPLTFTWSHYL